MADWLIARNMNMTFENVITLLFHPELNATKGNPAAAPSTLQDWGFLWGDRTPSEFGKALMENRISWNEAALVALSKRGANDANVKVKPFVTFAKVMTFLYDEEPNSTYLTVQAFGRLLTISHYDQITRDFCKHINDSADVEVGKYRDIWYNALTETGLFVHRNDIDNGAIKLVETQSAIDFMRFVALNGETMSECPLKSEDNGKYFQYMGSLRTGIIELLKDAPEELITATFPHYFSLANKGNTLKQSPVQQISMTSLEVFSKQFHTALGSVGLSYSLMTVKRFIAGILAKPFMVFTGLSGSGKTKLAQAFTTWLGVENTYRVVPVGADWTNNEKLLGYPNALESEKYVLPDTGVLKLMLDAALPENEKLPFFLILDEMNLSHVERYFADFLSAMESEDEIKLYDGQQRYADDGTPVPQKLKFPKNLFVIGTMNVDETTYMFSPKVLDRAQVIEFRVAAEDMLKFLESPTAPDLKAIAEKGAMYAAAFLDLAKNHKTHKPADAELKDVNKALGEFFPELQKLGAEFGYRSAIEIVNFVAYYLEASGYEKITSPTDRKNCLTSAIDAAILQKLLPKLHGSLNRLGPVLTTLMDKSSKKVPQANDPDAEPEIRKIYKLTYEKLERMHDRLEKNGFTSFAEA